MSKNNIETTIRFNLSRNDDRRAWEFLQNRDEKKYKSYSRAVILALNGYFDREKQLTDDPYLETREKEDAFLRSISETIKASLEEANATVTLGGLLKALQPKEPEQNNNNEAVSAALDFADSF